MYVMICKDDLITSLRECLEGVRLCLEVVNA